jgi:hypothetical protein
VKVLLWLLLTYVLFMAFPKGHADSLIIHGPSHHFKSSDKNSNNNNFGLGYAFSNGFNLGAYNNSNYKTTFYVAQTFPLNEAFSVSVALASGYGKPVVPAAIATWTVPIDKQWRAHVSFAQIARVVHLSIGYNLGK